MIKGFRENEDSAPQSGSGFFVTWLCYPLRQLADRAASRRIGGTCSRCNQTLLVMIATILLFGAAIGYNQLRVNSILTAKKVLPEGIPELAEHNHSQGSLTMETVGLNRDLAMVLGAKEEKNITSIRLKILNGTSTPGLATAAKKFFAEAGFTSIAIGDAPNATYSATLIRFRPEMLEWAGLIHYLIDENFEVELSEMAKEATPGAGFNSDIVIILTTPSILFEPYLSQGD